VTDEREVPSEWRSLSPGQHRLSCPQCGRRESDRTVSVRVDDDGRGGVFTCHRCGASGNWTERDVHTGRSIVPPAELERRREEQREAERQRHTLIAQQADDLWRSGRINDAAAHPYVTRKRIAPYRARVDSNGNLMLDARDIEQRLWSLQTIAADGEKRFLPGGRIAGTFHPISGSAAHRALVICEGFATGASIRAAVDVLVICAWHCGNLERVARDFRALRPDWRIIIAGDDDHATEGNPGRLKAEAAAAAVDGIVVVPTFAAETRGTDFNDLHCIEGIDAVRAQIEPLIIVPRETSQAPEPEAPPTADEHGNPLDGPTVAGLTVSGIGYQYVFSSGENPTVIASPANVVKWIWEEVPDVAHSIWRDDFDGRVRTTLFGPVTHEWSDLDSSQFHDLISRKSWFARVSRQTVNTALDVLAVRNRRDSVLEWMSALRWDGVARVDSLAALGFGAEGAFAAAAVRNVLVAAAMRQQRPGSKFDHCLVLYGAQGIGKSTALMALFGVDYVTSLHGDIGSKDALELGDGALCLELDELATLGKSQREAVKAFLSRPVDRFRESYGRFAKARPRRFVVIGTTNADDFLTDPSGERRFWPIRCDAIDLAWIYGNREQLWAEAFALAQQPDVLVHVVPDHADQVEAFRERDTWEQAAREWLARERPELTQREGISLLQLLGDALGVPTERQDQRAQKRAAAVMRRLGWHRKRNRHGVRWLPPRDWLASEGEPSEAAGVAW
jgi:putative DNA primase/helicase